MYFHGNHIYDTDSENLMVEGMNQHLPFPINFEDNFMTYDKKDSDFVSFDLGQPKNVEVVGALFIVVGQHLFNFSREKNLLLCEHSRHELIVHERKCHPSSSSTNTHFMHKYSAK